MDSTAEAAPTDGREEKCKSMGRRLLSRMKTALRRTDVSKAPELPSSRPTTYTPLVASAPPAAALPTAFNAVEISRQSPVPPQTNIAEPEVDGSAANYEVEEIARSQLYNDRFQALYKNLEVDPSNVYQMEGHVLRMHKPARMRVHRQCHHCHSEVGKRGHCEKCNHSFCNQCTRYPPKRTETEKIASRDLKNNILKERTDNPMIWPDPNFDPDAPIVITRPARREQQLVFKKVRQRVRRTCCQCLDADGSEVIFLGGGRDCAKCAHVRCTDCPRDPPKKDKYPYGYPGDAFGPKSIPHYRCHECYNQFPPGVENGTACIKCSHEKCDHCARLKPQKIEPKPDAELVKSVQEKIASAALKAS